MAAACRSTCGETRFWPQRGAVFPRLRHVACEQMLNTIGTQGSAAGTGNSVLESPLPCSRIQACRTAAVGLARGVQRSLRPFPRQRTCAPAPSEMSSWRNPVISDNRRPV